MSASPTPRYPAAPRLVLYPDPVLRRRAEEVTVFDEELARFGEAMLAVMDRERGVGLAAPQVGVSARIFVTNHQGPDAELPDRRIWINPRLSCSGPAHGYEEGCLSIPGIYGPVERPSVVEVVWQDVTGAEHCARFDGGANDFLAVVVQHEVDHLDGVLFLDHLPTTALSMVRRRLRDLEKQYKKATGTPGKVLRR